MSRCTKTILPMAKLLLKASTASDTTTLRRQRQIRQAAVHDRKAKDLPPLLEGTAVCIHPTQTGPKQWLRGTVTNRAADRSYDVQTPQGTMRHTRIWTCDQSHLRTPPNLDALSNQSTAMGLTLKLEGPLETICQKVDTKDVIEAFILDLIYSWTYSWT